MTETKPTRPQSTIKISWDDVPLHCPMPGMTLWNSHPRVYLPIEADGEAHCPYCGTHYTLEAFDQKPADRHG